MIVVAFAEMVVAHVALRMDEVVRGPVLVFERAPDRILVVDCDRIGDVEKANSGVCTPITTSPWSLYFFAQAGRRELYAGVLAALGLGCRNLLPASNGW